MADPSTLYGHQNVRANICFDCHGDLKAPDGTYSERLVEEPRRTFAAAICNPCKEKHLAREAELDAAASRPQKSRGKQYGHN